MVVTGGRRNRIFTNSKKNSDTERAAVNTATFKLQAHLSALRIAHPSQPSTFPTTQTCSPIPQKTHSSQRAPASRTLQGTTLLRHNTTRSTNQEEAIILMAYRDHVMILILVVLSSGVFLQVSTKEVEYNRTFQVLGEHKIIQECLFTMEVFSENNRVGSFHVSSSQWRRKKELRRRRSRPTFLQDTHKRHPHSTAILPNQKRKDTPSEHTNAQCKRTSPTTHWATETTTLVFEFQAPKNLSDRVLSLSRCLRSMKRCDRRRRNSITSSTSATTEQLRTASHHHQPFRCSTPRSIAHPTPPSLPPATSVSARLTIMTTTTG